MGEDQIVDLLNLTGSTQTTAISDLIAKFIQNNIDEELSPATISTRRSHLKQFQAFCDTVPIDDLTLLSNQFMDKYFVHFRETHSKATTNTDKRILKVFLAWVRDYKEIDIRAVPEGIKLAKEGTRTPKFIDREIIGQVIRECTDEQDKLIITVFAETGIRVSELVNIKVGDIKGDQIEIHGKGDKDRLVPLTDGLARELPRFIKANNRNRPHLYLFQNPRKGYDRQLTTKTVWRRVKAVFKELAEVDMYPHQLRHSYAVMLLLGGCDLVTIQRILGHDDINTTMIYLRITDQQTKDSFKRHFGSSFIT